MTGYTAAQGAGSAGSVRRLLLGVAATIVLVLGAAAGVSLGGKAAGEAPAAGRQVSIYASLGDSFEVELQQDGRQRHFRAALTALARDESVIDALDAHAPLIRGRLVTLFGQQDVDALRTEEGKLALRERVLATIREVLQKETGAPGVEQVFFTDLVLQ